MSTLQGGAGGIVTDGLVLHLDAGNYKSYTSGSTTWRDLTSNSSNGTLVNGPTGSFNNGGSIIFDGVNDYCDLISNQLLKTSTFTITSFVKTLSFSNSGTCLFTREGSRLNLGVYYGGTSGAYFFLRGNNYPTAEINGVQVQYPFALGTWYHLTYIVDIPGKNYKMYVNGSQIYSANTDLGTDFLSPTDNSAVLASRYTGTSAYANIEIANFQFYNRVLSATEILQNYNSAKKRFGL